MGISSGTKHRSKVSIPNISREVVGSVPTVITNPTNHPIEFRSFIVLIDVLQFTLGKFI